MIAGTELLPDMKSSLVTEGTEFSTGMMYSFVIEGTELSPEIKSSLDTEGTESSPGMMCSLVIEGTELSPDMKSSLVTEGTESAPGMMCSLVTEVPVDCGTSGCSSSKYFVCEHRSKDTLLGVSLIEIGESEYSGELF